MKITRQIFESSSRRRQRKKSVTETLVLMKRLINRSGIMSLNPSNSTYVLTTHQKDTSNIDFNTTFKRMMRLNSRKIHNGSAVISLERSASANEKDSCTFTLSLAAAAAAARHCLGL